MIRFGFRLLRSLLVVGVVGYLLFFVQLGNRTPFQHLMRITKTEEARELSREVRKSTKRIRREIGHQIRTATDPIGRHDGIPAENERSREDTASRSH